MRFRNTPSLVVEIRCLGFWRAALAECVATFLLNLLVCASWLDLEGEDADLSPSFVSLKEHKVVKVSLTAGLTIATLVQAFGHISGGHVNPAVTISMFAGRKISVLRAIVYVIAQCTGAVAGTLFVYGITPTARQAMLGLTHPAHGVTDQAAVLLELLLSFLHVFTIFATVDPFVQIPGSASLAIGLTVTVAHLVGIPFTGCSLNPARSLGPVVVTGFWDNHWIYWAGPLSGALLAMFVYDFIFNPSSQSNNIGADSLYDTRSSRSTIPSAAQQDNFVFANGRYARHNGMHVVLDGDLIGGSRISDHQARNSSPEIR